MPKIDLTNFTGSYYEINREERNLAAILYHLLLTGNNLERFLKLLNSESLPFVKSEAAIYYEYAYLRDRWDKISSNDEKRSIILDRLDPANKDRLNICPKLEFNEYFGAVPASSVYIQSPATWSIKRFKDPGLSNEEFLKICKFKWAFKIKPDIVVQRSKRSAICIECKLASSEGSYPAAPEEKKEFADRKLPYVKQKDMQIYLMEDLLKLESVVYVFIQENQKQKTGKYNPLTWKRVFAELDTGNQQDFLEKWIERIKDGH